MKPQTRAINTLVLVDTSRQAESIADALRLTGVAVQQSWVTSATEFSNALQREQFDLGIIFCVDALSHIPAAITRYPATPFLAVLDRYRNRTAESLIERGVCDVVGLSQPLRLRRVLERLLSAASLQHDNDHLRHLQRQQETTLHSVLQNTGQAVAYLHQGAHSYANAAYQQLTGLAELETVQQTPLLDLVDNGDEPLLREKLREIETGSASQAALDVTLNRPDGEKRSVSFQLSQSYFDDEAVVQLVAQPLELVTQPQSSLPTSEDLTATVLIPTTRWEQPAEENEMDLTLAVAPGVDSTTFRWHRVNNLRADVQERLLVSTSVGLANSSAEDTLDVNRQGLDQAMAWIHRHRGHHTDTQVFVQLSPAAAADTGLADWLKRQFKQRLVQSEALAVILPLTEKQPERWLKLARQLRQLGIALCFSNVRLSSDFEKMVQQNLVDFVFLDNPDWDEQEALARLVSYFRDANIRTISSISQATEVTQVWRRGLDCFVDLSIPADRDSPAQNVMA
ncbi:MAG: PAS domain-containing protein [Gammaproteobacteria bacterium]|nr:PAS domain-containing protein [Gammaproteobacteria bacterium]